VLLLDKPLGLSSNQALQKAKWLLQAEKAGHTGTLDPLATGVLPLCFGAATKFSQMHLDADKAYVAQLRLGTTTSTADAEGEVLRERAVAVSLTQVEAVLQRFTGALSQVPPMYSALKKDGRALYEYARAGQEVERTPRAITVHRLRLLRAELAGAAPTIEIAVDCSKGTYIRTLGEDIGEALGCGAHVSALRRIRTGGFGEAQTVSLQALEAMSPDERLASLMPPDGLLAGHALVTLDADNAARFLSGMRRRGDWPDADAVAVYADASRTLLGTGHVKAGELIPGRLLSPLEIGQYQAQMSLIEGSKLVV
jgi:tRNA pseudouridine55 synthase